MLTCYRLIIIATFIIYLRAGRTIYEKRSQLRNISNPETDLEAASEPGIMKTEVTITSEFVEQPAAIVGSSTPDKQLSNKLTGVYWATVESNTACSPRSLHFRAASIATTLLKTSRNDPGHAYEAGNAAWLYTKCAILFFTAILIT